MRRNVLFFLIALLVLHLDVFAADQQSDLLTNTSSNQLEYRQVPLPAELQKKINDKTLAEGGGREFYCFLPPNDPTASFGNTAIYICTGPDCSKQNPIRVRVWRSGIASALLTIDLDQPNISHALTANGGANIANSSNLLDRNWELLMRRPRDYSSNSVIDDLSFKITAEGGDVFVYVGSFSYQTADGYMVLPVHLLGNQYVHCSQKDNDEHSRVVEYPDNQGVYSGDFRTGFTCIAVIDNTVITAKMRSNLNYCLTFDRRPAPLMPSPMSTITSPNLMQNQMWSVVNGLNNRVNQVCDFTGTIVESTNDFAMISWTQRTGLPVFNYSSVGLAGSHGRDNLVEQLLPTEFWGREFVSVQFKGSYEEASNWAGSQTYWDKQPGQYFRVVGIQPATIFEVAYYDLISLTEVAYWSDRLPFPGDWREKGEGMIPVGAVAHGVSGAAYWKADKPVQVMQYASSSGVLYKSGVMDPAMVLIPSVEQYGHNTTFKTAPEQGSTANFKEHFVTLYIEGPVTEDNEPDTDWLKIDEIMKTVMVKNGNDAPQNVSVLDSKVYSQRVPGSRYFFARWKVPPDETIYITAGARIAGTVYGFGDAISYAWPTSMGLTPVGTNDTAAPKVVNSFTCVLPSRPGNNNRIDTGYVTMRSQWWDTMYVPAPDEFTNTIEDEGIVREPDITVEQGAPINPDYRLYSYIDPIVPGGRDWKGPQGPFKQGYVEYQLMNPYEDFVGHITYEDRAGHSITEPLIYIADKLRFFDKEAPNTEITTINFGSVVIGNEDSVTILIKNINTDAINVFATDLEQIFLRENNFRIEYDASITTLEPGESIEVTVIYNPTSTTSVTDYLCVNTKCLFFRMSIFAGAGLPMIKVTETEFGPQPVDKDTTLCFTVSNPGSLPLTITNATFDPAQVAPTETFRFVAGPDATYAALPTAANPWVIPAGGSVTGCITFHPYTSGDYVATLCFENDANATLDASYDSCVDITGTGIESGVVIGSAVFGTKRVCTENCTTVVMTNLGNFPITVKDLLPSPTDANWGAFTFSSNGDTLFSEYKHYYIHGINALKGKVLYPHNLDTEHPIEDREFIINICFTPKNEVTPYGQVPAVTGGCPKTLQYTVIFDPVPGIPLISGTGNISGEAILPKLEANGHTFPQAIRVGEQYTNIYGTPERGTITLTNASFTTHTTIYSIKKLDDLADLEFPRINLANWAKYDGTTTQQLPGQSTATFTLELDFAPQSTNPLQRGCRIEIISDAGTNCPTVDGRRYDTIWVRGNTYDDTWSVNNPAFNVITRCAAPSLPIDILNEGTVDLQIDSITIAPRFQSVLVRTDNTPFPIIVTPNGGTNSDLTFQFNACDYVDIDGNPAEGEVNIPITVHSAGMGSQNAVFSATPLFIPVTVKLPRFEVIPGQSPSIPIDISLTNNSNQFYSFDNAQIRSFTIVLNVQHSQLHFNGFAPIAGWDFNIVSQTADQVTISGTTAGAYVPAAGTIALPTALVMVGTTGVIPIEIASITFNDRDCCLRVTVEGGELNYEICAQVPRGDIVTSNTEYSIEPITPNPFTDKMLDINYSIGLDAKTTIKIFNSNGDLVKTAVEEYQKTGRHTATVNVGDLSSGAYRITISSGPYEDTQPLIIIR